MEGELMTTKDIKKGDIVTYRSGRVNIVNKPGQYHYWFNKDFKNREFGCGFDIMRIDRYVKYLWFYRLKTIYERNK